MSDEFDPEVFGELSDEEEIPEETPEAEGEGGEYAPQYPFIQALGGNEAVGTYLCQDPYREGSQVVQKIVSEAVSHENPDLVDHGFARLQGIAHPALALVRDFGWEGHQAFLIRDFVAGTPWLQALAQVSPEEILARVYELLEVQDYLYSQNVLHLHLKPENLFLVVDPADGIPRLKITDFGLAEQFHRRKPGETHAVGTPPYTAPEYAMNPYPDIRADLYSVGVIAYQALARRLPFEGADSVAMLQAQLKSDPKPLSKVAGVSKEVSDFIQKLLSRDPKSRFRDPREALKALEEILHGVPQVPFAKVPPVFSDPEEAFRYDHFVRMFRRIALQGRRWAFQGPAGSGKTFFARWIQRYFWINKKDVRFYRGREIYQIQGDQVLNPQEPLFVIIDDADLGPVAAWLETKPYIHVIVFGEDLAWAKQDPRWQVFPMENLDLPQLREVYRKSWGEIEDKVFKELAQRNRGLPGALVEQARALSRLGILRGQVRSWELQGEKLLRALAGPLGSGAGLAMASLDKKDRGMLSVLMLSRVPLSVETLGSWFSRSEDEIKNRLVTWVREEILERRIWFGQEFFQAKLSPSERLDDSITEKDVHAWIQGLKDLEWEGGALEVMDRCFSPERIKQDPELRLQRAILAGGDGRFKEVFQAITSNFVNGLPAERKGLAFEVLGIALRETGKAPQAESAYKNAFNQYRTGQDLAGQVRVLTDLGKMTLETGDQARALKFFEQALAFSEKLPESPQLLGLVNLEIARLYETATDFKNAEARYQNAVEVFLNYQHYRKLAKAYQAFAQLWLTQGEFAQAEYYAREALQITSFKEDGRIQGLAFMILAEVEESRNNPGIAMERYNEAVGALSAYPQDPRYPLALIRRAYFFENNRQLEKAKKDANSVLKWAQGKRDMELTGQAHLVLGKILRRDIQKLNDAFKQFEMAREAFDKIQDRRYAWECEFEKGEIERNRGNNHGARPLYEAALKYLDEYLATLSAASQEIFLKDGKRERVEMAIKWLE